MNRMKDDQVLGLFQYRRPSDAQTARIEQVRAGCRNAASVLLQCCPDSADRTVALRELRLAMMWGVASIFELDSVEGPSIPRAPETPVTWRPGAGGPSEGWPEPGEPLEPSPGSGLDPSPGSAREPARGQPGAPPFSFERDWSERGEEPRD